MSKTKKAEANKIRTVYGGKEAITQLLHNSLYGDVMEPIQEDYDRIWSEVETLFEEKDVQIKELEDEVGELTDDLQKMEQEKEEATDRIGKLEDEAEDLQYCVAVEVRGMEAREKLLNFIKTEIYPHGNDQHKYIKSE